MQTAYCPIYYLHTLLQTAYCPIYYLYKLYCMVKVFFNHASDAIDRIPIKPVRCIGPFVGLYGDFWTLNCIYKHLNGFSLWTGL